MALLYQATLRPTKLELLSDWLPGRPWYTGSAGETLQIASFRFDDPAGAVGMETILVRVGDGPVHQMPLTYREAPLPGGDAWLLGTSEHSVLGMRWVYDAVGDPVYAAALAGAIIGGTGQAEKLVQVDGRLVRREPDMSVVGGGGGGEAVVMPAVGEIERVTEDDPTVIVTDTIELAVVRRLDVGVELADVVLRGSWPGQETPVPLASARLR
ncbi:hypothetical protein ABZ815_51240 [Nonomuraea sp. NPDC047529]|uniref:CG0192-related protein n=1 Tax=Nonomuraea sp. NPDC047529 TaxID=3155623 RepID=UPI0033E0E83B